MIEDAADLETMNTQSRLILLRSLIRNIDPATLGLTEKLLLTDLLQTAVAAEIPAASLNHSAA